MAIGRIELEGDGGRAGVIPDFRTIAATHSSQSQSWHRLTGPSVPELQEWFAFGREWVWHSLPPVG